MAPFAFPYKAELVTFVVDHVCCTCLRSELLNKALLVCPRGHFVPEAHAAEAYADAPIRVEASQFNISAAHMHVTMLEALDLQPGHA